MREVDEGGTIHQAVKVVLNLYLSDLGFRGKTPSKAFYKTLGVLKKSAKI